MQQEACASPGISISSLRSIISTRTKQQISNKITILQAYNTGFYPRCRLQAQYTFCNKKGDGQKDSNLIQAQGTSEVLNSRTKFKY